MDPLGTTLGTVALFAPLFNACKSIRDNYRLTQTFGEDYLVVQRHIETQYARLEQLSKRPVRDLAGHEPVNVQDENDPTTKKLISLLAEMKKHSDNCTELISRYHGSPKSAPGTNATTLESPKQKASPHSNIPTSSTDPPDIGPLEVTKKVERKRHLHVRAPWRKSKDRGVHKAIETTEQPKLGTLNSNLSGGSQPSILNTAEVNEEYDRQRLEAARKQSSTSFRRRLSWAQNHKTALTELAEALRRGNNEIESLLLPAQMKKSALLLRANTLTQNLSATVVSVKRALCKLHEALVKLNAPNDTFQQSYQLSVQLREDSEVNRKQLLQEPKVHLRDNSFIFNIQREDKSDSRSTADLLFAETLKNPQAQSGIVTNIGSRMPELHDLDLHPITGGGVETLGFFRSPSPTDHIHVLFRDNSKDFHSPLDLANIVSSSDYRYHMNPTQLVQLVRLVMKSHLYFSSVRDSLDINPRLINFRYFCRAREKAIKWDVEKPLVLRPWLSFGFGSPRRYDLGQDQGVQPISRPSLIELGLVLYQICVGEVMDYGAGDRGVTKAKLTALKGLNRIDNAVGPTVSEIVQMLLLPMNLVAPGEMIGEIEETEYIINAVANLITYEEKIEDTVTDKEKEVPSPSISFNRKRPETSKRPIDQAVGGAVDNDEEDVE